MRRAALILCSLGCYPSSNFALPPAEGYLSRIILGAEPPFAHASPTEARSLPFTAGDDLILEALLYRETLAELGLAEGPIALEDGGRSPPAADAIWRTTIASGEFSGWDTVDGSELAERLRIPHFDANSCDGCITRDSGGDPICKLDCAPPAPSAPMPPERPRIAALEIPPDCPPDQVAYPGEQCHAFDPCPAAGWPDVDVDAFVRPDSTGSGRRDDPFGTIAQAVASGARRIALSPGTHDFGQGLVQVPLELYGACAAETILIAVLRMREDLVLHDVTVMGGIETCRTADIRRVHLHGGPMLGERAIISASDIALHESHVVLIGSQVDFQRVFISSALASFACHTSDVRISDAFFSDRVGSTLSVGEGCRVDVNRAVLRPWLSGAVVGEEGHLSIRGARIEGREGGIYVVGTATIAEVEMSGDEGLEVVGAAHVTDSIIESIDLTSGAALINLGSVIGSRLDLLGGKRGLQSNGPAVLTDLTIETEAFGVVADVGSNVALARASISSRVTCVDALEAFAGADLLLLGCETGLSSSDGARADRVRAEGVGTGAANFAGILMLENAVFQAENDGIEATSGSALVSRFLIEGSDRGATLRGGMLQLSQGRLSRLEIGLKLPEDVRPEDVMEEVSLSDVVRVFVND